MAKIELRNVSYKYPYTKGLALKDITHNFESGKFYGIIGENGGGKTTLCNLIRGLIPHFYKGKLKGDVIVDGVDIRDWDLDELSAQIGYVFQNPFTQISGIKETVFEEVAMGLENLGLPKEEIIQKVTNVCKLLKIENLIKNNPKALSGGQRQRVAIARALVTHPTLLLLDEPLAALDAKLREEMQIELINLQKEVGITFVYVTHDQTEALALSHRIAVMNRGRVEQLDEPSRIYGLPATRFVADFIGHCNLLSGPVTSRAEGLVTLDVRGVGAVSAATRTSPATGAPGTVALRPEKIRISTVAPSDGADNRVRGTVADLLYMGDVTVYKVETEGGARVEALLANSQSGRTKFFEVGDAVEMSWAVDAGHFIAE